MATTPKAPRKPAPKTGAGWAFNPDNLQFFKFISVCLIVFIAAAMSVSAVKMFALGLHEMELPAVLAWLPALIFDAPIIFLTGAALIQKRRANKFARVLASLLVAALTFTSAYLNHTTSVHEGLSDTGTLVYTIAPLMIFAATETLVLLVTKQQPAPRATKAKPSPAKKKPAARRTAAPKVESLLEVTIPYERAQLT